MPKDTEKSNSCPESSNLNLIATLLKLNAVSDQVFHQSMDIYITLLKTAGVSRLLLRSAEELKNAVENFDDAIHSEITENSKGEPER